MAKVFIEETTLTAIGDAIREKEGTSELIPVTDMSARISAIQTGGGGGNEPTDEELTISDSCSHRFSHGGWDWVIEKYGDRITTQNITSSSSMFDSSNVTNIPFELNFANRAVQATYVFFKCANLETVPRMNNFKPSDCTYMFSGCIRLREFPEGFENGFDWSAITSSTNTYSGNRSYMFNNCYSLKHIPSGLINKCNDYATYSYQLTYSGFSRCCALDELVDIAIPTGGKSGLTSNIFSSTFDDCNRLNRIVFNTNEDGTAKVVKLKGQTINLTSNVGWAYHYDRFTLYNSGITLDKYVYDDATYQALKNDPDWFTTDMAYSRYNHDSAVETLNSLPDASAYLASAGGTNTIKFKGAAGSATDGGAINTLTEEEIAVATAKGWTVTLA